MIQEDLNAGVRQLKRGDSREKIDTIINVLGQLREEADSRYGDFD